MLRRGIFAFGIIGSRCRCFHKNFLDLRLHCSPSFIKWLFSFKLTEFDDLSFMSRRDVGAEIIITTLKIQTRWMVKEFGRASCNRRSYQGQKLSMSMAPMLPTPVPQDLKIWTATPFCFISLVKVAWWKKRLRICSHHTANLNFLFLSLCVYLFKHYPSQFLSHWESGKPVFCYEELSSLPCKNQNKSLILNYVVEKFKFAVCWEFYIKAFLPPGHLY